jgi:hypothetical protein
MKTQDFSFFRGAITAYKPDKGQSCPLPAKRQDICEQCRPPELSRVTKHRTKGRSIKDRTGTKDGGAPLESGSTPGRPDARGEASGQGGE